ncbi:uncharacterized protein LOC129944704 [Eupeodes corollae]|uniref:uncharacterized protein LOC129944704 n=1 Tax=Eupeodes corollae TaxID=290404 RepID=UPI002490DB33|nr:uncharacterized protein LOC129944704 [Eupeodes corollae]
MSNKVKIKKRRDRNTLTFYEKIAVIRHHEANQLSRNNLARMFQCCTTQIRKIIENKDEILTQWQAMCETNSAAVVEEMSKKRREFEMKAVGFILHQWVERCRELQLNMVINDATLKIIAMKMATVLNITDFKPTARWIERFRLKFKYKNANLSNPRCLDDPPGTLSVEDIIIEFKSCLPSFMRQEISNITSVDMEESVLSPIRAIDEQTSQQIENVDDNKFNDDAKGPDVENRLQDRDDTAAASSLDNDDECSRSTSELISAEKVLEHLSLIQQFLITNSDYQAMTVAAHLEHYIEQKYILSASSPSPPIQQQQQQPTEPIVNDDEEEFVILVE